MTRHFGKSLFLLCVNNVIGRRKKKREAAGVRVVAPTHDAEKILHSQRDAAIGQNGHNL